MWFVLEWLYLLINRWINPTISNFPLWKGKGRRAVWIYRGARNQTYSCQEQARLVSVLSANYQLKVVTVELPGVMCYSWNILFLAILKKNWLLLSTNCHNFKLQASEHIDLIHKVIMSGTSNKPELVEF